MSNSLLNSLKIKGSEEMEEFTFRIYPDDTSGRARELITKQYAMDLDEAIEEATKILDIFEKYHDYNISKDTSIAESQIQAKSNGLHGIIDII